MFFIHQEQREGESKGLSQPLTPSAPSLTQVRSAPRETAVRVQCRNGQSGEQPSDGADEASPAVTLGDWSLVLGWKLQPRCLLGLVTNRLSGLDHLVQSPGCKDETVTAPTNRHRSFGALPPGLGPGAAHLGRADLGDVT